MHNFFALNARLPSKRGGEWVSMEAHHTRNSLGGNGQPGVSARLGQIRSPTTRPSGIPEGAGRQNRLMTLPPVAPTRMSGMAASSRGYRQLCVHQQQSCVESSSSSVVVCSSCVWLRAVGVWNKTQPKSAGCLTQYRSLRLATPRFTRK